VTYTRCWSTGELQCSCWQLLLQAADSSECLETSTGIPTYQWPGYKWKKKTITIWPTCRPSGWHATETRARQSRRCQIGVSFGRHRVYLLIFPSPRNTALLSGSARTTAASTTTIIYTHIKLVLLSIKTNEFAALPACGPISL